MNEYCETLFKISYAKGKETSLATGNKLKEKDQP